MKILYVGCVKGSVLKLKYVLESGGDVVCVVTLDPSLKERHSDYAAFDGICNKKNVPLLKIRDINAPSSFELIKNIGPDIIFVFGWSQMVKRPLLDLPRMGIIGFHPTILPENRGRHPITWALINGQDKTGATFFFMDEKVDSGDIIAQQSIAVDFEDDASTLMKKVNDVSRKLIHDFMPKLINKTIERIPQDNSKATYLRKRTKKDGYIDWKRSAVEIYNLVRGLTRPYCGASAFYNNKEIIIWKCRILPDIFNDAPATIIDFSKDTITVQTKGGALELLDAEIDNQPIDAVINTIRAKHIKTLEII